MALSRTGDTINQSVRVAGSAAARLELQRCSRLLHISSRKTSNAVPQHVLVAAIATSSQSPARSSLHCDLWLYMMLILSHPGHFAGYRCQPYSNHIVHVENFLGLS